MDQVVLLLVRQPQFFDNAWVDSTHLLKLLLHLMLSAVSLLSLEL